mmetsp:Transcript_55512/g.165036  ORF Transcript_55512/g.165036 Transcript_55512/m.165036 type:complete len:206 (+) Transcript_55512:369-986(+)
MQMLTLTLTSGISTTPSLVGPATFVLCPKVGSSGPSAMPRSWAAFQLMALNIEPVSTIPSTTLVDTAPFRLPRTCTGTPRRPPGSCIPLRCTEPGGLPSAFATEPGSLNRCSCLILSSWRSKRPKKGRPTIPCRWVPRAFSAICACTNHETVHPSIVPREWPPSRCTSGKSTVLLIGMPRRLHVAGLMVASIVRVVDRRKVSGFS